MILSRIIMLLSLLLFITQISAQIRIQRDPLQGDDMVENESILNPGENIDDKIKSNFFLRAEVTKQECYVGENIMAVYKAYSRIDANSQVLKRPSLRGFSVIEMVDAYSNQAVVEKFNGKYYNVHLIRKVQLFPLQAGDILLEPAEVESVLQFRPASRPGLRNFFRRNSRDPLMQRQLTFRSPEVNIHVNPLPEKDQPADFSGAVGNFSIRFIFEDTSVEKNEQVRAKLSIAGSGNFQLITDPGISWPAGVHASDPSVSEDLNKYDYPLSGVKDFEYVLDHRDTGTFVIPAVKFSYFDPSLKAYKTVETQPVIYTVKESSPRRIFVPENVFHNPERPLHIYYFGALALIIIGVIIFLAFKKSKK